MRDNFKMFGKAVLTPVGLLVAIVSIVLAVLLPAAFKIVPVLIGAGVIMSRSVSANRPTGSAAKGWVSRSEQPSGTSTASSSQIEQIETVIRAAGTYRAARGLGSTVGELLTSTEVPSIATQSMLFVNGTKILSSNARIFPRVILTNERLFLTYLSRVNGGIEWLCQPRTYAQVLDLSPYEKDASTFKDESGSIFRLRRPIGSGKINRIHRELYETLAKAVGGQSSTSPNA